MASEGWAKSTYSNPNGNCVEVWRKSSYSTSTGACVEVLDWRKSSYSNTNGACVETTFTGDGEVLVRDTKNKGEGPILRFPPAVWDAFIKGIQNGEMQHG